MKSFENLRIVKVLEHVFPRTLIALNPWILPIQVLVVTVADVPEGKSPKRVANELFNYFGIGSMERENGVLVAGSATACTVNAQVSRYRNHDNFGG